MIERAQQDVARDKSEMRHIFASKNMYLVYIVSASPRVLEGSVCLLG